MTWFTIVLILISFFTGTPKSITIDLYPHAFAFTGADVRVEIHIPHNPDNRALDVILMSEGMEVSHSRMDIQPEDIPVHNFTYKELASGEYVVEAVLSQYTSKGWKQVRVRSNTLTIIDR